LQDEIRRSEESRYDHRLHGVLLVAQGLTCPEVASLLGDVPRTVEYWELRRSSIRTGRRIIVITDNAQYHHARLHKSWREEQAPRLALDFLPPYSPKLNRSNESGS
jgi:hypothetical protein